MIWRPRRAWRRAIFAGVLLIAIMPVTVGIWLIEDWRDAPVFPLALIAFGPLTVLSLFVAFTPVLEGWWLRKRRGQGDGGGTK